MYPALAGRFPNTVPPGKPECFAYFEGSILGAHLFIIVLHVIGVPEVRRKRGERKNI